LKWYLVKIEVDPEIENEVESPMNVVKDLADATLDKFNRISDKVNSFEGAIRAWDQTHRVLYQSHGEILDSVSAINHNVRMCLS